MLDSSLLQTNFVGRDGFIWWIGQVADPKVWRNEATDPEKGWAFRCKTRIIGYHTFDKETLPDDQLPWTHVLVDASKGAGQGALQDSNQMLGGETVFGFFLDGEEAQQPVIFGALPRTVNPLGPDNTNTKSQLPIFTGRTVTGKTTYPTASGGDATGVNNNANNKVGLSSTSDMTRFEGGMFCTISDLYDPKGLGPHTAGNACENDAISEITHAIGSFLTTINGLTEFAGEYIDTFNNTVVDIKQFINKASRIVNGAVKSIIRMLRDKVVKFLGKRFKNFIALIVPEPQQPPVGSAFKRIMDIIFCVFEKLGFDIFDMIKGLFQEMVGKALNPTVCAIEQAIGAIMGSVNDSLSSLLAPIMGGLDWLTGAIGGIGNLLGKVSSYVDMLLGFLACDKLQCKEYDDWIQGEGGFSKPPRSWANILNATEKMNRPQISEANLEAFEGLKDSEINQILEADNSREAIAGPGDYYVEGDGKLFDGKTTKYYVMQENGTFEEKKKGWFKNPPKTGKEFKKSDFSNIDVEVAGLTVDQKLKDDLKEYVKLQSDDRKKKWRLNNVFVKLNELADEDYPPNLGGKFSLLSILGNEASQFFDCNEKTNNPKTQDDLGRGVPPGFVWGECIPPKVEVLGDGTKTAALLPIVSSVDGSILTLEILDRGFGYTEPPTITIVDKTRHGGGARAEAILDSNGSIVSIFMYSTGRGYCPATNVVPPKYPVTEGPGIGITGGYADDGTNLDSIAPFITFTTPSDDAVGVQTSASLSITFNETIVKGTGEIVITESTTNIVHERINVKDSRISFLSDRIIKIDPKKNLNPNTEYFVSMSEGSFKDTNDNSFAGIARTDTYNFTTRGVSGIGSQAVGIVTTLVASRPGIGYQPTDYGMVGQCRFDLVLTPAGSIVGVQNINCKDKHAVSPEVEIFTSTGLGAELIPVITYSPDFVADIGERPGAGMLVVDVVDCVYSLPKTQVGWVNGNPYYGPFHIHPNRGVKMVGAEHVSTPHAIIYNTKEESLGQTAPVTYTPAEQSAIQQTMLPESTVSDTTEQSSTMDTTTQQSEQYTPPQQQPQQPQQPQQQQPPSTPPPTPPSPPSPPSGGGGSGGGGGGGYGGGY